MRQCSDFLLRGLISRFLLRLVTYFRCFQLDRFLPSCCLGTGDSDWCSSLDLCDLYGYFVFWTSAIQSRMLSSAVYTFGSASLKSGFRFLTNLVTFLGVLFAGTYWALLLLVAWPCAIVLTLIAPYGVRNLYVRTWNLLHLKKVNSGNSSPSNVLLFSFDLLPFSRSVSL